jgi:hypothetical protein
MSKPEADLSSGTSLGDALRLPKRHPACRRREAQSGSHKRRKSEVRYRDVAPASLPGVRKVSAHRAQSRKKGRQELHPNGGITSPLIRESLKCTRSPLLELLLTNCKISRRGKPMDVTDVAATRDSVFQTRKSFALGRTARKSLLRCVAVRRSHSKSVFSTPERVLKGMALKSPRPRLEE